VDLSGESVSHVIWVAGKYLVTLRVTDIAGNTGEAVLNLTVLINDPPVASAGKDVQVGQGTHVVLNGTGSTDDIGLDTYWWTLTYEDENVTLRGPVAGFTFHEVGEYIVTLHVTDTYGRYGSDSLVVIVLDTEPPLPQTIVSYDIQLGDEVAFNASTSTDNVAIADLAWTVLDVDGNHSLTGPDPIYRFDHPGELIVILTVTDTSGNVADVNITVKVRDITPPRFLSATNMSLISEELVVSLNHKLWTDDDPGFPVGANFTWTIKVDDEVFVAYGELVYIWLPRDGDMHLTATAVDASGNTAIGEIDITLNWRPTDAEPPTAMAGADVEVVLGMPVSLTGTYALGELALDGYEWQPPHDITVVTDGPTITWTPASEGEFEFAFSVWDWMGNEDSDTVVVRVVRMTPTVSVTSDLGQTMTSDIVVKGTASGDVDIQRVEYRIDGGDWELADGTTSWSFQLAVADLSIGEHTLEVRGWDGFSHGTTGPVTFVVGEPPVNGGGGGDEGGFSVAVVAGILVAVVVAVLVAVMLMRRRSGAD
jgi:hypothetical protein